MAGVTETVVGLERYSDLRGSARREDGTDEVGGLAAFARRDDVEERAWVRRLRYWLNSFRGFASFDVRGIDDRVRP